VERESPKLLLLCQVHCNCFGRMKRYGRHKTRFRLLETFRSFPLSVSSPAHSSPVSSTARLPGLCVSSARRPVFGERLSAGNRPLREADTHSASTDRRRPNWTRSSNPPQRTRRSCKPPMGHSPCGTSRSRSAARKPSTSSSSTLDLNTTGDTSLYPILVGGRYPPRVRFSPWGVESAYGNVLVCVTDVPPSS